MQICRIQYWDVSSSNLYINEKMADVGKFIISLIAEIIELQQIPTLLFLSNN